MDYKIQLNHIRENCCLTKIPNDANAFLVLSVINNLWQEEKASDSLIILENDVEISKQYHRSSLTPAQDLTGVPANVVAICNTVWTPAVIAAYQAAQESTTP